MANNLEVFMKNFIRMTTTLLMVAVFQSNASEVVDKSLPVDGATNVSIENLRGEVSIIGWDKDSVHVKGKVDDKAEEFIFEKKGAYIVVKVAMPRNLKSGWNDSGSDLVINVPKSMRVDFTGVSTDVKISNIDKSSEVKTVSGDIEAKNLSNHVTLTAVSGDIMSKNLSGKIEITAVSGNIFDKSSAGTLEMKAVSGDLRVKSAASEVSLNTVSGEMDFTLADVEELFINTVSGNVNGTLALIDNGMIKMSSVSGDLVLGFTNDIQASFRMKSNAGGDLVNKLTDDEAKHAKYGPSSKLYFETGNASSSVKASTVSGKVKVYSK